MKIVLGYLLAWVIASAVFILPLAMIWALAAWDWRAPIDSDWFRGLAAGIALVVLWLAFKQMGQAL